MSKATVLSVDDDENLQTVIRHYLEDDAYKVVTAGDVASALDRAGAENIDVVLLDLMLPDGEGLSLIPQFRNMTEAAIIVVSGKSETTEKIVCLEMGADDYLTKPFEMRELSARIKAVLRRMGAGTGKPEAVKEKGRQADKITFGQWTLDRTQYQLFDREGNPVHLTTGEFKLLEALALSPHRALSRERLFELTREGEYDVYDRAIDIQVGRLRKKLGDDPRSPKIIKTVRGVGYMFCSETRAA